MSPEQQSEFKFIIDNHIAKYPAIQPEDIVKLAYQNEFGGGHMVASPRESLDRLRAELASYHPKDTKGELFEDIGNRLCRINLRPVKKTKLSPDTVNNIFIYTANSTSGTNGGLIEKLEAISAMYSEGGLPFPAARFDEFCSAYRAEGMPSLSHSDKYRDAYRPAYRVVKSVFRSIWKLIESIDSSLAFRGRVTVAIDGNSGAGKTSLAGLLGSIYDANILHMDDFFLPQDKKTPERLATPGGNSDVERFKDEVLRHLTQLNPKPFSYRPYDCQSGGYGEPVEITPRPVSIVEGVYSLHPRLARAFDVKVFMKAAPDVQRARILARSNAEMLERFEREWIPLEDAYFSALRIEKSCGVVLELD